ncbi:MAG: FtsX-like permease family protein [Candidatus Heimdallarchaeota archaeon]|nr:FtsX-like permease family protein [Candidatus Heimdallarchaeota archaeon]MCK5049970.1 FtsX-like permease family protein [Candidatus Heimdallarchaeota archaeon]
MTSEDNNQKLAKKSVDRKELLNYSYDSIKGRLSSLVLTLLGLIISIGFLGFILISDYISRHLPRNAAPIEDYFIWIGVITFGICVTSTFNALFVSIDARTKEIGVLMAMGATKKQVRWLLRAEALIVGIIGGVSSALLGILLGLTTNFMNYGGSTVEPIIFSAGFSWRVIWSTFFLIFLTIGVVILASARPVSRVTNLSPAEAINPR